MTYEKQLIKHMTKTEDGWKCNRCDQDFTLPQNGSVKETMDHLINQHGLDIRMKKSRKRSIVWEHFTEVEGGGMCDYCGKIAKTMDGSTSDIWKHLKQKHKEVLLPDGNSGKTPESSTPGITSHLIHDRKDVFDSGEDKTQHAEVHTIWDHFIPNPEENSGICKYCQQKIKSSKPNMKKHLLNKHLDVLPTASDSGDQTPKSAKEKTKDKAKTPKSKVDKSPKNASKVTKKSPKGKPAEKEESKKKQKKNPKKTSEDTGKESDGGKKGMKGAGDASGDTSSAQKKASGSAIKRPRLSLNKAAKGSMKLEQLLKKDTSKEDPSSSNKEVAVEEKPDPAMINGVAALHNLGNTCYMNSVLQILRFTPGFTQSIAALAKEIKISKEERAELLAEEEEDEDENLTWKIVLGMNTMYTKMSRAEKNYLKGTGNYLAIRPYDILDTIENLNPMFEGNQQQDAHELLRCVLAYVQDAAKELNKFRKKYREEAEKLFSIKCQDIPSKNKGLLSSEVVSEVKVEIKKENRIHGWSPSICRDSPVKTCLGGSPLKTSVDCLSRSLGELYKTDIVQVKEEVDTIKLSPRLSSRQQRPADVPNGIKEEPVNVRMSPRMSPRRPKISNKENIQMSPRRPKVSELVNGWHFPSSPVKGSPIKVPVSPAKVPQSPVKILAEADRIEPCELDKPKKVNKLSLKRSPKKLLRSTSSERIYRSHSSELLDKLADVEDSRKNSGFTAVMNLASKLKEEESLSNGLGEKHRSASLNDLNDLCQLEVHSAPVALNDKSVKFSENIRDTLQNGGEEDMETLENDAKSKRRDSKKRKLSDPSLPASKSRVRIRSKSENMSDEESSKVELTPKPIENSKGESIGPCENGDSTSNKDAASDDKVQEPSKSAKVSEEKQPKESTKSSKSKTPDKPRNSSQPSIRSMFCRQPGLKRTSPSVKKPEPKTNDAPHENGVIEISDSPSKNLPTGDTEPSSGVRKDTRAVDKEVSFTMKFNESREARALQRNSPKKPLPTISPSKPHVNGSGEKPHVNGSGDATNNSASKEVESPNRKNQTARKFLSVKRTPQAINIFEKLNESQSDSSNGIDNLDCQIVEKGHDFVKSEPGDSHVSCNGVTGSSNGVTGSNGLTELEETPSVEDDAKNSKAVVNVCERDVSNYLDAQRVVLAMQSTAPCSDVIEEAFQGEMALRTRCLECEASSERREPYLDISIAVRRRGEQADSDEEDEEANGGAVPWHWMMSALNEDVERLQDSNKYLCEPCVRLVEAERSTHYVTMPQVMTFHLKRFAATQGLFGGLTKINDHVVTPMYLPCLQEACAGKCKDDSHRYELYGIVTHTGISISSGHYVAYVKLRNSLMEGKPSAAPTAAPTSAPTSAPTAAPTTIKQESGPAGETPGDKSGQSAVTDNPTPPLPVAPGNASMAELNNNQDGNNNCDADQMEVDDDPPVPTEPPSATEASHDSADKISSSAEASSDSADKVSSSAEASSDSADKVSSAAEASQDPAAYEWLECDDEHIRLLTGKEFEDLLSPSGCSTPYMLFYTRLPLIERVLTCLGEQNVG